MHQKISAQNEQPTAKTQPPTLRERKKQKNMAAMQAEALRLFAKQGYAATTVEQIAAAAEVSPSTFFRYFSTKEAVVLYDGLDPLLAASFQRQPRQLGVIEALRQTLREVFVAAPASQMKIQRQRTELIRSVPELRGRMLDDMALNIDTLAKMIAQRTGRAADELAIRNLAGAIIGVIMASFLQPTDGLDALASFDAALAELQAGLMN